MFWAVSKDILWFWPIFRCFNYCITIPLRRSGLLAHFYTMFLSHEVVGSYGFESLCYCLKSCFSLTIIVTRKIDLLVASNCLWSSLGVFLYYLNFYIQYFWIFWLHHVCMFGYSQCQCKLNNLFFVSLLKLRIAKKLLFNSYSLYLFSSDGQHKQSEYISHAALQSYSPGSCCFSIIVAHHTSCHHEFKDAIFWLLAFVKSRMFSCFLFVVSNHLLGKACARCSQYRRRKELQGI